ncbi:uncharacterized protein LOC127805021 isoform X2 [Diospyros lotus]|uniref:uncharacterized protein LOC127805021 isoform X2 n=1 Tax=Diospyros lotus TaxID=55363 RepID=UPI0022511AF5|nr:uncharacterized protein LOC127805021 isoform X2 [Diospyros lotus]
MAKVLDCYSDPLGWKDRHMECGTVTNISAEASDTVRNGWTGKREILSCHRLDQDSCAFWLIIIRIIAFSNSIECVDTSFGRCNSTHNCQKTRELRGQK